MAESMLDALTAYYRDQGILSTHFTCGFKGRESNGCAVCVCGPAPCRRDHCTTSTGPSASFVSSGYEAGPLPRLLILSLDRGIATEPAESRTPQAARRIEGASHEIIDLGRRRNGKTNHWFRTHELAWYVLRRFDPGIGLGEVRRHIALANAAKCCQNRKGGSMAGHALFENCKNYLAEELRILAPEILVTQGREAELSVASLLRDGVSARSLPWGALPDADDGASDWMREFASPSRSFVRAVGGLCDSDVFWLHTHHPTSRPPRKGVKSPFYRQVDFDPKVRDTWSPDRSRGWIRYAGRIQRWWNERS